MHLEMRKKMYDKKIEYHRMDLYSFKSHDMNMVSLSKTIHYILVLDKLIFSGIIIRAAV